MDMEMSPLCFMYKMNSWAVRDSLLYRGERTAVLEQKDGLTEPPPPSGQYGPNGRWNIKYCNTGDVIWPHCITVLTDLFADSNLKHEDVRMVFLIL